MQHTDGFDAIVLLSRDGYSHASQEQLNAIIRIVQQAYPRAIIVGAMVDHGDVSLPAALQQAAESGMKQILVLSIFFPSDRNLQRWLAKVIVRWHHQWQGQPLVICMADPLGDHAVMGAAVVHAIQTPSIYLRNVIATPPEDWESDSSFPDHFVRGEVVKKFIQI